MFRCLSGIEEVDARRAAVVDFPVPGVPIRGTVYQSYGRYPGVVLLTGHEDHRELTGMVSRHFERVCLGSGVFLLLQIR
jgi:hypothetical protein